MGTLQYYIDVYNAVVVHNNAWHILLEVWELPRTITAIKFQFAFCFNQVRKRINFPLVLTATLCTLMMYTICINRMINMEQSELFEDDQQSISMRKL